MSINSVIKTIIISLFFVFIINASFLAEANNDYGFLEDSSLPDKADVTSELFYDHGTEEPFLLLEYPTHIFKEQTLPVKITMLEDHKLIEDGVDHCNYVHTMPGTYESTYLGMIMVTEVDITSPGESDTIDIAIDTDTEDGTASFDFVSCFNSISPTEYGEWGDIHTLSVNVVDPLNHPPKIAGPDEIRTTVNNQMSIESILELYIASDYKNNLITDDIILIADNYSENYTVPGSYKLVLEIEDDVGGSTEKEIAIENTEYDKPVLILKGDQTIYLDVGDTYLEPGATAYSNDGTILTPDIVGTVDSDVIGEYDLTYTAIDDNGLDADPVRRKIVVEDNKAPVIKLKGKKEMHLEYLTDWEDPGVIIEDNYDKSLDVTTTGSIDTSSLGSYTLRYNVMDSSGNRAETMERTVHVSDKTSPTLNTSTIKTTIENKIDPEDILSEFSAQDNYDGDLTHNISIDMSNYLDNQNKIGEYEAVANVSDSSGNETSEPFTIITEDTSPPVIEGPAIIYKTTDKILSSNFFLRYFTAEDNYDGNVKDTIRITDNEYSGNADRPGEYALTIEVSDESENVATHQLTVKVIDDLKPSLIIDEHHFTISPLVQMTPEDVVSSLKAINNLPNDNYVIKTNLDTYTLNYDVIGTYHQDIELTSETGDDYSIDFVIEVIDEDNQFIEATPTPLNQIIIFSKDKWWIAIIIFVVILGLINKKRSS